MGDRALIEYNHDCWPKIEDDPLERGLTAAVRRSSDNLGQKIERIIRERYPKLTKNALDRRAPVEENIPEGVGER